MLMKELLATDYWLLLYSSHAEGAAGELVARRAARVEARVRVGGAAALHCDGGRGRLRRGRARAAAEARAARGERVGDSGRLPARGRAARRGRAPRGEGGGG